MFGKDIAKLHEDELHEVRKKYGMLFQSGALFDSMTVGENIALPLRIQGQHADEISTRVTSLLQQTGLSARQTHRVGQLSGGEAQRVAIAVALASSPRVLLADEPTGELDEATAEGILDLLEDLRKREGMAIMTVTHNKQVGERAGHSLTMRDGVLTHGT